MLIHFWSTKVQHETKKHVHQSNMLDDSSDQKKLINYYRYSNLSESVSHSPNRKIIHRGNSLGGPAQPSRDTKSESQLIWCNISLGWQICAGAARCKNQTIKERLSGTLQGLCQLSLLDCDKSALRSSCVQLTLDNYSSRGGQLARLYSCAQVWERLCWGARFTPQQRLLERSNSGCNENSSTAKSANFTQVGYGSFSFHTKGGQKKQSQSSGCFTEILSAVF